MPVLVLPELFEKRALEPTATLFIASRLEAAPVPLLYKAESPTATRLLRSVFNFNAWVPIATLLYPEVFVESAKNPLAVLLLPAVFDDNAAFPLAVL